MAAEDYEPGAAKQDPATGAVAVRTVFPDIEALHDRQWGVMTTGNGGHYATYDRIKHWLNLNQIPGDPDPDVYVGAPPEESIPV